MRGIAWRDGAVDDVSVTIDELAGVAHDPARLLWVDLVDPSADDSFDMTEVVKRWNESPALLARGAGALLYGLLDTIIDEHFDTIQGLDDAIEDLEETLFQGGRATHDFVRQIYGLRKDLVRLRRVVLPMREVLGCDHRGAHRRHRLVRAEHPYPGYLEPFGVWQSVTIIAVTSIGLAVFFRRRGWL